MPQFAYKIRDRTGNIDTGTLQSSNVSDATHSLQERGNTILSLQEDFGRGGGEEVPLLGGTKKVKKDDIIFFAAQLAVMVDTGVPLSEALDLIGSQSEHGGLKKLLSEVSEDVKGGMEFSNALEKHPRQFDTLFVSLMRASEASGTMGPMLQRVSDYMEEQRKTRKRIKGAMVYPSCMLGFCLVIIICLLVFILPKFEKIYAGKKAVLPAPTRVLLAISHGFTDYWYLILGGTIAVVGGLIMYLRTPGGQNALDTFRIRMPIMGGMFRKACLAKSLRCLSTMVTSGVGMIDGLEITSRVSGNRHFKAVWDKVSDGVKEGSNLSEGLMDSPLIPGNVCQMISAGEKSGKLGMVMDRVARFCEEDLKVAVKAITDMIEPVMIIVMGVIVGGIAMALLMPVFKMAKVAGH
ncbi:MAG: type II secretion system F family protein [Phycisphaerae bacterium]|jgi:type IV pilus assembly protein PilC|nr:type II secretion system F family protein [Phycisphaerae bacterium]